MKIRFYLIEQQRHSIASPIIEAIICLTNKTRAAVITPKPFSQSNLEAIA
jgi:hypothetical protein